MCLSLHNKVAQTGALKQERFAFHGSGAWKSKLKVPADLGSGEGLLLGLETAVFSCVLTWPFIGAGGDVVGARGRG